MKTFMFPGQGSQSKGMGGTLFDEFQSFTEKADNILGYSIKELCLEDPQNQLDQTEFTQPALYVVNALSYYKKIEETPQEPDFLVGHSLGEFNALLAAECFDFEAGLKLVKKRGDLMRQSNDGGMAAILNATKKEIEDILKKNNLSNIDLANYNTPSQIVISGSKDEIVKAESLFQNSEMHYLPLNTSGAFHSRFMLPVKEKFFTYLKKFKLSNLKIATISNVSARPYDKEKIIENLSAQIASTVKWSESIEYLIQLGVDADDLMEFEEIGYGNVLTRLVSSIKRETQKVADEKTVKPYRQPQISANVQNDIVKSSADSVENTANHRLPKKEKVLSQTAEDSHQDLVKNNRQNTVKDQTNAMEKNISNSISSAVKTDSSGTSSNDSKVTVASVEEKVNIWNKAYSIGTKVKSTIMDHDNLETRTEAVVLFGHRAAVYMKGYNGYFDLDEINPL